MKKILKYTVACFVLAASVAACTKATLPERITIQNPSEQSPIVRDNQYYANLRAYKLTKHKVSFGWYGSWTAVGASYQSRLESAPDSMDIISIWSQWHSLTQAQMDDKAFVQKTLGTKVIYTIFAHEVPETFMVDGQVTAEGLAAYAKAYAKDSMDKYQYDGIDLDYEPEWGGVGPLVDGVYVYREMDPTKRKYNPNMTIFVTELAKWVGPASGTGRLFVIDGVPFGVEPHLAPLFDYGIVQAYGSRNATGNNSASDESLQGRFNKARIGGWKPEQYIFTENFEAYWQSGGVTHTDRTGTQMPSFFGMAIFNPNEGACGGFGTYHMEYEYGHSAMPYKFMRQAIQLANPAGGWKTPIEVAFSSTNVPTYNLLVKDDGTVEGSMADKLTLSFSRPVTGDVSFTLSLDNSLVKAYNDANGTKYSTIDASLVQFPTIKCSTNQVFSPEGEITLNQASLQKGYYLIPVVITPSTDSGYAIKEGSVHYIALRKLSQDIDIAATALTGTKITPTSEWTISCYIGTNSTGGTGVWNCDSDEQKAAMFDGKLGTGWYAGSQSWSWGSALGGNYIIDLGQSYDINGFRWHHYQSSETVATQCVDFAYSEDGGNWWPTLSAGVAFTPTIADKWRYFQFKRTVKARYIRVYVGKVASRLSMDEAEVYAPAN